MINTIFVSARQLAHLARTAGWQPLPWSPVFPLLTDEAVAESDAESLRSKGLLIDQAGQDRVNAAIEIALAAICEPDNQVEIRLPGAEPVYLCRAGTMSAGWHGYADGGVAVSFPLTMADRHRLVHDLLSGGPDAPAAPDMPLGQRLTATPLEVEILMAIGERSAADDPVGTSALIELVTQEASGTPATTIGAATSALVRLGAAGLVDNHHDLLSLTGAAEVFASTLSFGFLVKRTRLLDPAAPAIVDALHVYRTGNALVVTRQILVDGEVELECHQVNRSQLADMILTLTLDAGELAGIATR